MAIGRSVRDELRRLANQGRRELGEATVAFPGQTPMVQPEVAGLYHGQERLNERLQQLEQQEAERGKGREMEPG